MLWELELRGQLLFSLSFNLLWLVNLLEATGYRGQPGVCDSINGRRLKYSVEVLKWWMVNGCWRTLVMWPRTSSHLRDSNTFSKSQTEVKWPMEVLNCKPCWAPSLDCRTQSPNWRLDIPPMITERKTAALGSAWRLLPEWSLRVTCWTRFGS